MRQHAWSDHSSIYASGSFRSTPQQHFPLSLSLLLCPSFFLYLSLTLSPLSHSYCVPPAAHGADSLRIAQSSVYRHLLCHHCCCCSVKPGPSQAAGSLNSPKLLIRSSLTSPSRREVWILSAHSMVTTTAV